MAATDTSTGKQVTYERDGHVAVLTLDSPPANFFTDVLIADLDTAVEAAYADQGIRCLVIKAAGPNFCGGANVKMFQGVDARGARSAFSKFLPAMQRIEDLPFPTLCVVHGLCLAAGLEIALACDQVWAGESAVFSQVEAMIGTSTLLGGIQRLAERCGSIRAKQIVFTADMYPAEVFERWNIINRVVADDDLLEKSMKYAHRLAEGPTLAHNTSKRLVRAWLDSGIVAADRAILDVATPLFESGDMINGVETLLEQGARSQRENARFEGR
jgi:enoyl-CoA hydratase/carnithine racemase